MTTCVFCSIVARQEPASFVYEDDLVAAFMTLHPTAPGECLVIPKAHVDHFTDVPDEVAQHIMLIAQRIGCGMREVFPLERVGYLVHGFGVAHAHLVIVPQQGPNHITSDRLARVVDGKVVFDFSLLSRAERSVLDENARKLSDVL
ncbi:MAG TPA: HIT family protein [Gemmatimonadaceae bacterium]|nr:HIT family protein [Gemmatimonadaceae bacterium]